VNNVKREAPGWAGLLPALPRLAHQALSAQPHDALRAEIAALRAEQMRHSRLLALVALLLAGILAALLAG